MAGKNKKATMCEVIKYLDELEEGLYADFEQMLHLLLTFWPQGLKKYVVNVWDFYGKIPSKRRILARIGKNWKNL